MSDTAAFFAKKKKKKAFKFNANKIDKLITSTDHVDAPAVSSAVDESTQNSIVVKDSKAIEGDKLGEGGDWDDVALAAKFQKSVGVTSSAGGGAAELLDMKALEKKRNEQDDIAERLRVEETKAALAAAREGMEKEGQRLKEAKLQAKSEAPINSNRFGKASANIFGSSAGGTNGGSKWVPPHMRGNLSQRSTAGSSTGYQRKVDTQDESLFPDLATADKIIAKEEEQRQQANRKSKAPASGWGTKKISSNATNTPKVKVENTQETKTAVDEEKSDKKFEPKITGKIASPSVPIASTPKKKTKKKKKDLSTFKA